MLPPSSQRKSSQKRDFELGLRASHHLKNNPPKGRIPKRWDKNLVQEILPEGRIINRVLLIEGYLHVSTFYSGFHSSKSGSYAYKYIRKVKHNLRLLSKLGTTYVSSHHPTTQPSAPNQYLRCLVDPPFDIKSHKIQTNKEPRNEESASCMQ